MLGSYFLLFYLALSYLRPYEMYPALAVVRPMLILAIISIFASLTSLPQTMRHFITKQVPLLAALVAVIVAGRLSWLRGALMAFQEFMITLVVFYLVLATITNLKEIRRLGIVLGLSSLFLAAQGIAAVHLGFRQDLFIILQSTPEPGVFLPRVRALGFFADPNDMAQALLVSMPIIGLAWKKRAFFRNLLLVLIPYAILLYGIYLTKSRGGILGLLVLSLFTLQRRMGKMVSLVLTGGIVMGLMALDFTGGRGFSSGESSASTRIDAWYAGMEMLRSSPVLGVGYDQFTEYHRHTAHNSFVLCFAELGLLGYFLWLAILIITIRDLAPVARKDAPYDEDIRRWARAIQLSLYAFLATSWFLSRTYVVTLYLLIAMSIVIVHFAKESESAEERVKLPWWMVTGFAQAATIVVIWLTVRLRA
jgi:O-antigen ligase